MNIILIKILVEKDVMMPTSDLNWVGNFFR